MKKNLINLLILLFIILPIYITFTNNIIASNTRRKIEKTEVPEKSKIVDSIEIAGKLSGNGNGMQYFGAILLESDLSEAELTEYYRKYRKNEWSFLVSKQSSSKISVIDKYGYSFKNYDESKKDKYYIIYSWGSSKNVFLSDILELDIRGH